MNRSSPPLIVTSIIFVLSIHHHARRSDGQRQQLRQGYYASTCPNAESVVRQVVENAASSDPTMPAGLLRLHFHDCFIHGCDGSVLIDKPDGTAEKTAGGHQGLKGFDVVEKAKEELETRCPGVVSCSDIVALMARDSIVLSSGPTYGVETGRKDGLVSNREDAGDMVEVDDSVDLLTKKFSVRGLSQKDMVVLNAAHTIGTSACFFITSRLYGDGGPDAAINHEFLPALESTCTDGGENTVRVPLDEGSEMEFDEHFLTNVRNGFTAIRSDAAIYENPGTKSVVDGYLHADDGATGGSLFMKDFVDAIVRMGRIGVITDGRDGEIRRTCSAFNN